MVVQMITKDRAKTFRELEWESGTIMALDNPFFGDKMPFVLAIPEEILPGFNDEDDGLQFYFPTIEGKLEEWTLKAKGDAIGLWATEYNPKTGLFNRPAFAPMGKTKLFNGYTATHIYSGEEEIRNGLTKQGRRGLDVYADMLGKEIVFERGWFGEVLESLGLESLLSPQLRIEGYRVPYAIKQK